MDGTTACKPIINKTMEKYYDKCKKEKIEYYKENKERKSVYGRYFYKNVSKEEKEMKKVCNTLL